MAYVLTARYGAVLLATAFVALVGLFILFTRPDRAQNRRLAFALIIESCGAAMGEALMYMTDDPASTFAYQAMTWPLLLAIPFLYFAFYLTLDTRIGRALERRRVGQIAILLGAIATTWGLLNPHLFVTGVMRAPEGGDAVYYAINGPFAAPIPAAFLLTLLIGLAFSLAAFRAARTPETRTRAAWILAAFTVRDVFSGLVAASYLSGFRLPGGPSPYIVASYGSFVLLLGYAILRAQLFDIDLKIKWTIRRGTVVGILAVAFVVVAEIAQNWLSDAYGYVAGGVAAGALLLALRPLDRVGANVAERAMPNATGTPEYLAFRKHEVYRQALADAATDGVITDKERAILNGLRKSLDIDASVAQDLEKAATPGA